MVSEDAEEILAANGESLAGDLSSELETGLASVQTLSHLFAGIIERASTPRRENADVMLQQLFEHNPNILTAWMFWEENAFDGNDEEYVNSPGHDSTGRYIPVWSQTDTGAFIVEPVADYDQPGDVQDNLNRVFETGEAAIWEPFTYEVDGEVSLVTSIVAPVTIDGVTAGMTGIDIALDDLNELVGGFSFYESGFAGLLSNHGTVLAHQLDSLLETNYLESAAMADDDQGELIGESIRMGEQVITDGYSNALEKDVYRLFSPVTIGEITTPWSALLVAPVEEVVAEAQSLTQVILIVSLAVTIVLAVIIVFVTRGMVRPIQAAVEHGEEMAAGNFSRLPTERSLKRRDELGDLTRVFATITKNMSRLIGNVQASTTEVLESSDGLDAGARQSASAANEVASSIEEVALSAENQMQSAEESAKSMEEMTEGVQTVAETAAIVSQSANDMSVQANEGQETLQNAIQQMGHIQAETNETKKVIDHLQAGTEKINDIVSVINDISEQKNLLALNAAIEAARAGEAGSGFAVVADEVRKLADETRNSTLDIQQLVETIQTNTTEATESMDRNEKEVNEGILNIEEVGQAFEQIIRSIQHVVGEIEDLSAVSEEMSAMTEEIAAASEEIASSAEESSSHTQQVAAAAEEQLATMESMLQTSAALTALANDLNGMLRQFDVLRSKE